MGARPAILVFDSGLGGLTVYREIIATRPDADFVYLADDAMNDGLHGWFNRQSHFRETEDLPGDFQLRSIQLVDDAFVSGSKRPPAPKSMRARLSAHSVSMTPISGCSTLMRKPFSCQKSFTSGQSFSGLSSTTSQRCVPERSILMRSGCGSTTGPAAPGFASRRSYTGT